jgi:hypothetical protein
MWDSIWKMSKNNKGWKYGSSGGLPSKCEDLSSNPSYAHQKQNCTEVVMHLSQCIMSGGKWCWYVLRMVIRQCLAGLSTLITISFVSIQRTESRGYIQMSCLALHFCTHYTQYPLRTVDLITGVFINVIFYSCYVFCTYQLLLQVSLLP